MPVGSTALVKPLRLLWTSNIRHAEQFTWANYSANHITYDCPKGQIIFNLWQQNKKLLAKTNCLPFAVLLGNDQDHAEAEDELFCS